MRVCGSIREAWPSKVDTGGKARGGSQQRLEETALPTGSSSDQGLSCTLSQRGHTTLKSRHPEPRTPSEVHNPPGGSPSKTLTSLNQEVRPDFLGGNTSKASFPLHNTEARQQQWDLDVTSDVLLSCCCCCCPSAGADTRVIWALRAHCWGWSAWSAP